MSDPERESHLYYVMAAGALHPLLSISPFPSFSPSQTPPPTVSLFFALPLCMFFGLVLHTQSSLPTCLCAVLHASNSNVRLNISICLYFHQSCTPNFCLLGCTFSIPPSARLSSCVCLSIILFASNDCPPPAFDRQLSVCTCLSHLMLTFAPVAPPENQTWTLNSL